MGLVLKATAALLLLAVVPALFFIAREGLRRRRNRTLAARLATAMQRLGQADTADAAVVVRDLEKSFDARIIERALFGVLTARPPPAPPHLVALFEHFGLIPPLVRRAREATAWAERAEAIDLLGRLGVAAAIPALVAALRDPHEDGTQVKRVAAEALARLAHGDAVPLLIHELETIDESASPRVAEALVAFGPLAVPSLVELLGREVETAAVVWAVRILGRIGDNAAAAPLIPLVRHRHDLVRAAAAEALGSLGHRSAVQVLIDATLRDPVTQVRAQAAAALGRLGADSAVDVLIATLADPDYGTRLRALEALEMIRPSDTTPLERALRDPSHEVRRRAALALESVGYLDVRIARLDSEDQKIVRSAYEDILQLGRAGLVDSIAGGLQHESFRVRAQLARACGELGERRVGAALLAILDDSQWPVRARVAEAVGRLRPPEGVSPLGRLLSDPEIVVREAAAQALTGYAADEVDVAYPHLLTAFDRGTVKMRGHVIELIARLSREEAIVWLVKAAEDPSDAVRLRAVQALVARRSRSTVGALVARLTDTVVAVRTAAVDALGAIDGPEALEALIGALPGAAPEVRERIAEALARMDRRLLLERIAPLLVSESLDVRLGITWTLGKSGDVQVVPMLAELLRAPEPKVRASAAGALGKIACPEVIDVLRAATLDPDARTRAAAVNALGRLYLLAGPSAADLARRLTDPDPFVRNRSAVALASIGGAEAEQAFVPSLSQWVDEPTLDLATALLGTEAAVRDTMMVLADQRRFLRLRSRLQDEAPWIRATFFARLRLTDPGGRLADTFDQNAAVDQYHRLLVTSQSEPARRMALEALARMGGERSLQVLADAIGTDPSAEIRRMAVMALVGATPAESTLSALARAVFDPAPAVSVAAARALGKTGDQRWGEVLFRRLRGVPSELESAVVEALAGVHRADPLPFVNRMMASDNPNVIASGLAVVTHFASPRLVPLLSELLKSREAVVRVGAALAIGAAPGAEALAALQLAARDPDESVRVAAVQAMAIRADPQLVPEMAALRFDPSPRVRATLATTAERFGSLAGEILGTLTEDTSATVIAAVVATQLAVADAASLTASGSLLSRLGPDAREALRKDSRAAVITLRLAETLSINRDPEIRRLAVVGIAALAHADYEQHLLGALHDPSPPVRISALEALAPLERGDVRARLTDLLDDPDVDVRRAAQTSHLRVVR